MKSALLVWIALCGAVLAQATVAEGADLCALWRVDSGVAVQFGRSVQRIRADDLVAEAATAIDAGVQLFDWDGRLLQTRGALAHMNEHQWDLAEPPLRWAKAALPLRVRMLQKESLTLPHRDGVLWVRGAEAQLAVAPAAVRESAGYGLGDTHEVVRITPWSLRISADVLVVGSGPQVLRVLRGGAAEPLHWSPGGDDHLGGFPWSVPPLLADFGAAGPTLVLGDARSGMLALYRKLETNLEPVQVLRVEGGLIATALFERAGERHLLVLRTRKIGLVEQLEILKSSRLPLELMDYPLQADGLLPRSPRARIKAFVPVTFSVNNDLRAVALNAAVFMTERSLLLAGDDGRVLRHTQERGPAQEVAALGPGRTLDPLGAVQLGAAWVFGWRASANGGKDRVLSLPMGDL